LVALNFPVDFIDGGKGQLTRLRGINQVGLGGLAVIGLRKS